MTDLIIAISLCIAVAIVYATAALIQVRYAHLAVRKLLRLPMFWLALGLNALGAALHVTSLAFGPLSLIQPLGVLTLVIAVPFAATTAKRKVTRLELLGMTNTVIGLAGLTLLISTAGATETLTSGEVSGLIGATTAIVAVFAVLGARTGGSPLWEAAAGGIGYSACSALCQTVVVTVGDDGLGALLRPVTIFAVVAIATFAIAATLLTQRSYRNGLGAPLAVTNLVNPASATVIGVALLGESLATSQLEVVLAVACGLLSALGVAQLARARDVPVSPTTPPREDVGAPA